MISTVTEIPVTNTQVAVKYRRNAGSLSIDMSRGRQSDNHSRPTYRPTYRSSVSRLIDRCSTDMLADISSNTSQSTYRPTLNRYVDWHIGWHSADMSTDTSVDCQSRGAQNNPSKARSSNTENFEGGLEYSLHSFPQPHTGHFSDCLHLIPTIPRQVCKTTGSH